MDGLFGKALSNPTVLELLRVLGYMDAPDDHFRTATIEPLRQTARYIGGQASEEELLNAFLGSMAADQTIAENVGRSLAEGGFYDPVTSFGMAGDMAAAAANPLNWVDLGLGLLSKGAREAAGAVAGRAARTLTDLPGYERVAAQTAEAAARGLPLDSVRGGYTGIGWVGRGKNRIFQHDEILDQQLAARAEQIRAGVHASARRGFDETYGRIQENLPQIREWIQRGLEMGADKWYHTDEILQTAIEATGSAQEGRTLFDFLMNLQGIMSSGASPVDQNRRANVIYRALHDPSKRAMFSDELVRSGSEIVSGGEQFSEFLVNQNAGHAYARSTMYEPTQAFAFDGQLPYESIGSNKVPTYTENLRGNVTNATVDRHAARALLGDTTLGPPGSAGQYAAMEAALIELAREFNLPVPDLQAALWVGAGEFTGIETGELFSQIFMKGAEQAAKEMGTSVTDVLGRFWRGELPMRAVVGEQNADVLERVLARAMGSPMGDREEETYRVPGYSTGGRF